MVLADDSTESVDIVGTEDPQTPFALLSEQNLRDLLEVLDERERKIIFHRFGLGGGEPKTLEEVGNAGHGRRLAGVWLNLSLPSFEVM
jgi:RNA polymerase primary sigma factor